MSKEAAASNIVPLPKPKQEKHSYLSQTYVLTYIMETKHWKWTVYVNKTYKFEGECKDKGSAVRAAKREIENWGS